MKCGNKQSGQGLIEYLIITCLVAVSAIAVVSVVGQNLKARYANISAALRGKRGTEKLQTPSRRSLEQSDFGDFIEGSTRGR